MKLLSHSVEMYKGFANDAMYRLVVDKMPERSELRYTKRGQLYWAEKDGYVNFFAYSGPGEGYGGRHFPIALDDGTEEVLIGPWSSRAGAMHGAGGFPDTVDVIISEGDERNGPWSGAVTRAWLIEQGLETLPYDSHGETIFLPAKDGQMVKPPVRL